MPITAQAAKKLRHDRKRTGQTMAARASLRDLVKTMRKSPSAKTLAQIFSAVDKAVKRNIIHANKAARFKSRLAALLAKK